VLNNLEILVEVIFVLKLVFFIVYETNGVIQERATILTPFQILRRKKTKICFKTHLFFRSNTGWGWFDILDGKNTLIFLLWPNPVSLLQRGKEG